MSDDNTKIDSLQQEVKLLQSMKLTYESFLDENKTTIDSLKQEVE